MSVSQQGTSFLFILFATTMSLGVATPNQEFMGIGFEFNQKFLGEIEAALGAKQRQAIEERIEGIENTLRPIYVAMQKNANQQLGSSAVRYVLHRFFMQQGWSVRGLERGGQAWHSGSPTKILEELVPENVQHIFEEQLAEQGFGLREVAILAATFKHLVRNEKIERLRTAYRVNNLPVGGVLDETKVQQIFDVYMASSITGTNISAMSLDEVQSLVQSMDSVYPRWGESKKLVHTVRRDVIHNGALNFPNLKRVAEEVSNRLGAWTTQECMTRKHQLLAIEDKGSGRVRVSQFYKSAHQEGKWYFGETTDYLRQLGALDESDPNNLRVIIPNWVNSISNCMEAFKHFSICCINECDELLTRFEREFNAPTATPTEIATFTAALPSETVLANRTLPISLVRRLNEIAENHGGRIPLHGRLFQQWMHHAYPHECPFPHVSGTTNPLRVSDWESATGSEVAAKEDEMLQHIHAAHPHRAHSSDVDGEEGECAPWMEEEELLEPLFHGVRTDVAEQRPIPWAWLGFGIVTLLLASRSGIIGFVKPTKPGISCACNHDQPPVYFV